MSDPGGPPIDDTGGSTPPPPPPPPPPPGYGQPPYSQPSAGYGQPGYGQPGYSQPAYGYAQPYAAPAQTEGSAIGALIAAIVSWMVCPVIPAIVALAMIPGAKRKIDASGGRLTGDGLLTAAKWVAWINIAMWGLLALLLLALLAFGVLANTPTDTSDFSSAFGSLS